MVRSIFHSKPLLIQSLLRKNLAEKGRIIDFVAFFNAVLVNFLEVGGIMIAFHLFIVLFCIVY